jgi:hypothetical protein
METCIYCNKPMVVATEGRGFITYRCGHGCPCHRHIETGTNKPIQEPTVRREVYEYGLQR